MLCQRGHGHMNDALDGPVLVVHDDEGIRAVITAALALEGIASTAATHADALVPLDGGRPALVLLDLDRDSAALREAFGRRYGNTVAIIGLTTAPTARNGSSVGASALVAMPFALDDLVGLVARFCRTN